MAHSMKSVSDMLRNNYVSKKFKAALKKVPVNEQEPDNLQTFLHIAACLGNVDAIKVLLKAGADPNIQDMNGWTALHCATAEKHLKVAQVLLGSRGIDVNILTIEKTSVLHYLVRIPKDIVAEDIELYRDVFRTLVDRGVNMRITNVNGEGAIHSACWRGNKLAVELLLNADADPRMLSSYKETPLHYAVRSGQQDIVELLCEYGAEPELASENGKTPIDLASEFHQLDILEMLIDYRDNPRPVAVAAKTLMSKPLTATGSVDARFGRVRSQSVENNRSLVLPRTSSSAASANKHKITPETFDSPSSSSSSSSSSSHSASLSSSASRLTAPGSPSFRARSTTTSARPMLSSGDSSKLPLSADHGIASRIAHRETPSLKRTTSELLRRNFLRSRTPHSLTPTASDSEDGAPGPGGDGAACTPSELMKDRTFLQSGRLYALTPLPSNRKKKWSLHFFVLARGSLFHFESSKAAAPLQSFPAASFTTEIPAASLASAPDRPFKHTLLFLVRQGAVELPLAAETQPSFADWMRAFRDANSGDEAASLTSPANSGVIASPRSPRRSPRSPMVMSSISSYSPIASSSSSSQQQQQHLLQQQQQQQSTGSSIRSSLFKEISDSISDSIRKDIQHLLRLVYSADAASGEDEPPAQLGEFLLDERHRGVQALCKIAIMSEDLMDVEEFSQKLVRYFSEFNKDLDLIKWAITAEVLSSSQSETPFRSTNIYTQILSAYLYSKEGRAYLCAALSKLVQKVAAIKKPLEVDRSKAAKGVDVSKNLKTIVSFVEEFLQAIFGSIAACPVGFRQLILHARIVVTQLNPEMGRLIPGGFLFLRFFCPAITVPVRWGLIRDPPSPDGQRVLLIIAKVLQNIANNVEFDGTKEHYMVPFNPVIQSFIQPLDKFFNQLLELESINLAVRRQTVRFPPNETAQRAIQTQYLFYLRMKIPSPIRELFLSESGPKSPEAMQYLKSPQQQQQLFLLPAASGDDTGASLPPPSLDGASTPRRELSLDLQILPSPRHPGSTPSSPKASPHSPSSSPYSPSSSPYPASPRLTQSAHSLSVPILPSLDDHSVDEPSVGPSQSFPADLSNPDASTADFDEEEEWQQQVASAQNYRFFAAKKVKSVKQVWPLNKAWTKSAWPPQTNTSSKLIDLSELDPAASSGDVSRTDHHVGYLIESGSAEIPAWDADAPAPPVEDEEMGTAFYSDFLHSRDHINYIAFYTGVSSSDLSSSLSSSSSSSSASASSGTQSEPDPYAMVAIISVEKGGKHGGGDDLKAIVRYPGDDDRVFLSVPRQGRPIRSGSFSGMNKMARTPIFQRKDVYSRPLIDASPPLGKLTLERIDNPDLPAELLTWELRFCVKRAFKFGFLLHLDNQTDENAMYSNSLTKKSTKFLNWLGDRVQLKDFDCYRGGLDTKRNTTGTHSYFTRLDGYEIMFHVAPLLPFDEKDAQRLEKKRHLGNDVLIIVFSESTNGFNPRAIHSHFNHVFAVVRPVPKEAGGPSRYEFALVQKGTVGPYGPFLPENPIFPRTEEFRKYFLTKLINAERRALEAEVFAARNRLARKRLIEDMVQRFKK